MRIFTEADVQNGNNTYPFAGGPNSSGRALSPVARGQLRLTALDLRFEQHCEGGTPALHGAIHWSA